MADRIIERTDGTLEIQVFSGGVLGGQKDNLEQIVRGVNLITFTDPAQISDYVPDFGIMNAPYIFKDPSEITKLGSSDWHAEMRALASEQGLKVLDMDWLYGVRHLISNEVITSPEDMQGLKVRVPSTNMWIATIKAMGGTPTVVQWSEAYSALGQGVVDAAESPIANLYIAKFHEVAKNVALTGHFTAASGLVMSQEIFETLSEEQQTVLMEEVNKTGEILMAAVLKNTEDYKKKMEEAGVTFNEVDREAFRLACRSVYDEFPNWSDGLAEKIQTILSE